MNVSNSLETPSTFKQSRTKLWIRTVILTVFGTLFTLTLYPDMASGVFSWKLGLIIFLLCLTIGFWMSRLVPMGVHQASKHITLSFDRLYFSLIILLVLIKAVTSRVSGMQIWSDIVMCVILGLMIGRLSGICLRVRALKVQHNFITRPTESK